MNQELKQEIAKAERSEGFIVMISSRNNGKLNHYFLTQKFLYDDIPIVLKKLEEMLSREMSKKPSDSKDIKAKPTKMPPEYRK